MAQQDNPSVPMTSSSGDDSFNSTCVDLDTADPAEVICYLLASPNDYNGQLGARISALFVILIVSTCATFFPVVAAKVKRVKIPRSVYLFARYFGSGVIVATAFIHLLDPAYGEIGPNTCVGMTGNWSQYSWPPAIVLVTIMFIFILNLVSVRYVEMKYGITEEDNAENVLTTEQRPGTVPGTQEKGLGVEYDETDSIESLKIQESFQQQFAAFLILEFGVIFHSVIIGLNLAVAGDEFAVLYPVLVFHQSFEGLGIGARMSAIPFPRKYHWLPWVLCAAYGLTTPIAIAIGLGIRETYQPASFTASIVSGVLDSMSAGILIYTGLVELLAKDFLYDPARSRDNKRIAFALVCVNLGAGIMALLGKWA